MAYQHWKIENLPWDRLDPAGVGPGQLEIVKAAALVEYNARDYAAYLCRVFEGDKEFQADIRRWADEEVQHGRALGLWAEKVDPAWSLEKSMARFRAGYKIEHFADCESVRGSRAGELIARCMVETGTSSYYTAIGKGCAEPVLKEICAHIAADEFRHYKLFYDTLKKYLERERMSKMARVKIALSRIAESEDDELSYAYFAANAAPGTVYERKFYNGEYMKRAYRYYQQPQISRAVSMIFKACGIKPQTLTHKAASRLAWWLLQAGIKRAEKAAKSHRLTAISSQHSAA